MPLNRKRRHQDTDLNDALTQTDPPEYGKHEYWNARYKAALLASEREGNSADTDTDEPIAYHDWYFTYDELRPLILPLIFGPQSQQLLGDQPEDDILSQDDTSHEVGNKNPIEDGKTLSPTKSINNDKETAHEEPKDDSADEEQQEQDEVEEEEEEGDDDEEEHIERPGLVHRGPVTVLEVGCGDRPLGIALAIEFCSAVAETTGTCSLSTNNSFRSISCSDYSPVVIDVLKEQFRRGNIHKKESDSKERQRKMDGFPLHFEVLDATALPQSSNSIDLVLEKGTIDAVLSDSIHGKRNAIQIMSECGRVVTDGGYIVLISHLNAHFPAGMSWLESIVLDGLKQGDPSCNWMIEVHGKCESDLVDDASEGSSSPSTTGPAVYIISKVHPDNQDDKKETIPVRFFSY